MRLVSRDFEAAVGACVDKGMTLLGQGTKEAVYWHIEHAFGLKREDAARRPADFWKAVDSLFGSGSAVLERAIIKEMSSAFGLRAEAKTFGEAVSLAAQGATQRRSG